jgi:hypothetical protein
MEDDFCAWYKPNTQEYEAINKSIRKETTDRKELRNKAINKVILRGIKEEPRSQAYILVKCNQHGYGRRVSVDVLQKMVDKKDLLREVKGKSFVYSLAKNDLE